MERDSGREVKVEVRNGGGISSMRENNDET